jgi:hypothetical protein
MNDDRESLKIKEIAHQAQGRFISFVSKVAPFGLQLLVSGMAYGTGLGFIQLIGAGLRISCHTRLLGPCLGAVGVAMASALSGQATRHLQSQMAEGKNPIEAFKTPFWRGADLEEILIDAISGVILFKLSGGAFRRLMPSDLRAPGAHAFSSVPVSAGDYASESQKSQLVRIFKRDGCHHCGSKRGPVIGDHIPPTKMVLDARKEASLEDIPYLLRQIKLFFVKEQDMKQAYYAQCQKCSQSQAALMRHHSGSNGGSHRRSALRIHGLMVQPGLLPGLLVGLRQYVDLSESSSGGKGPSQESGLRKNENRRSGRIDEKEKKSRGGLWSWVVRLAPHQSLGDRGGSIEPLQLRAPSVIIEEVGEDIWEPVERDGEMQAI